MEKSKTAKLLTMLLIVTLVVVLTASVTYFKRAAWASDRIRVVTTILPMADFVRQVGGDRVDVVTMVAPGDSPHTLEFAPSKLEMLSQADMYVKAGSGVDFELALMDDFIALNSTMLVVDCAQGIDLLGVEEEAEEEDHDDDHHHGVDPHIWLSPINAKQMVSGICAGLIEIDPAGAVLYTESRNEYLGQLDQLNEYIELALDGYDNRNLMIYHPSFGYFAHEYGLTQHAIELEGSEATIKTLASSIDLAQQYNLNYVFVSPLSEKDKDNASIISAETGGQLKEIDPLPSEYISNMRDVADAIALEIE